MEGTIVSFRRGRHTVHHYQMLINVNGVDSKEKAQQLLEKKVVWSSPAGKEINGKITGVHGSKGVVKVQFEKGMPGQSLGAKVNIV